MLDKIIKTKRKITHVLDIKNYNIN